MQKNTAGKWIVFAFQDEGGSNPGEPVAGDAANITANVRIDGGAANAVDDTNPTELEDGYYIFDITAVEANGDLLLLTPVSSTANVNCIGVPGAIYTTPPNFPAMGIESDGDLTQVNSLTGHTVQTGDTYALANGVAGFVAIDTVVDAVKVVTDALPNGGTLTTLQTTVDAIETDTQDLQTQVGTAGAGLTDLGGMSTAMKAEVEAEANDALVVLQLDHLLHVADASTTTNNSIIAKMVSKSATAAFSSFVNTTDSLEAIRDNGGGDATAANQTTIINAIGTMTDLGGGADIANNFADLAGATFSTATDSNEAIRNRGDAAWTTGAGGSDRLLMNDTTIAAYTSNTSFTLTAGSTSNDAYNNCTVVIEGNADSTIKSMGIISDYVGSTKTVTLKYDPNPAVTFANTDKIYILAESSLKSTDANRQLDVTATGAAGIDWANVENPTTAVDLSGTDIQLCDTVTTNTDMRGTDSAATASALATAQLDLDTITGTAGALIDVGTGTGQLSIASGVASADMTAISGDSVAADNAEKWFDGTGYAAINSTVGLPLSGLGNAKGASDLVDLMFAEAVGVHTGHLANLALESSVATVDTNVDSILVDTGTTLEAHLTDIKGTGFAKDTHSLTDIEAYADLIDDGTSGLAKIATDVAAILVDTGTDGVALLAATQASIDAIEADTNELQGDDYPTTIAAVQTAVDAIQTDLDNGTDGLGAIKTAVDGVSAGTSPILLKSTTIATLTSQTVFTLTDGSTDDDAYNGMTIIVIDGTDTDQSSVATIIDYVGSTRTVTLQADPGIFTVAVGDTVRVVATINSAIGTDTSQVGWLG